MKELVFATNNGHKLKEISKLLEGEFKIVGLKEKGIFEELSEDYFTLEENAFQKADYVHNKLGISCFADDTGLEIEALKGEPGVFSARYSRMGSPMYLEMEIADGNIRKVLENLNGVKNRKARFRTIISLIYNENAYIFEGIINGTIGTEKKGNDGFGYDPIFIPENYKMTFAEMDLSLKNQISHRALAVNKLIDFLKSSDQ